MVQKVQVFDYYGQPYVWRNTLFVISECLSLMCQAPYVSNVQSFMPAGLASSACKNEDARHSRLIPMIATT